MPRKKKEEKPRKKGLSTNQFINLSDVRGEFLYTKDHFIYQYLKVQPISTALMTDPEKALLTAKMARELSPVNVPFKILFLTRATDVRRIVEYYEGLKASTTNSKKRENLTKTIRWFSQKATSGDVLERQTYIALWTEGRDQEAKLAAKTLEFRNALAASGVSCAVCDQTDIVNMLGLFYNPAFAVGTPVDFTNKTTFLEGAAE